MWVLIYLKINASLFWGTFLVSCEVLKDRRQWWHFLLTYKCINFSKIWHQFHTNDSNSHRRTSYTCIFVFRLSVMCSCQCASLWGGVCDVRVFIFSMRRLHGAELFRSNLWVIGSWTLGKLKAAASQHERKAQSACSPGQLQINNKDVPWTLGNILENDCITQKMGSALQ